MDNSAVLESVVRAAQDVIPALTSEPVAGVEVVDAGPGPLDVSVVVGFAGALRGLVMLQMSEETALVLSGKMLGQDCRELGPMEQSCLSELGNMVVGSASGILEAHGYGLKLAVPAVVLGRQHRLVASTSQEGQAARLAWCRNEIWLRVVAEEA